MATDPNAPTLADQLAKLDPAPITAPATAIVPTAIVSTADGKLIVHISPLRGILFSSATGALRIVGAFLIAHGAMSDATVNAMLPDIAQAVAGAIMATAGQAWAWWRETHSTNKIIAAAQTASDKIVFQ